jgi:hypothetical protein
MYYSHSVTQSLTYSVTHALTHSCTHSLIHTNTTRALIKHLSITHDNTTLHYTHSLTHLMLLHAEVRVVPQTCLAHHREVPALPLLPIVIIRPASYRVRQ